MGEVIATYSPDLMVITLKKPFEGFRNSEKITGFHSPEDFGYFFHEWIHYFHNTSTISGFAALMGYIRIWGSFHNFYISNFDHESYDLNELKKVTSFLKISRSPSQENINYLNSQSFDDISIINYTLKPFEIYGEGNVHTLFCDIECIKGGEKLKIENIEVRTHDIIENVAALLESMVVLEKGGVDEYHKLSWMPYRVVEKIIQCRIPHISKISVVKILLTCLQSTDAPFILNYLIGVLIKHKTDDTTIDLILKAQAKEILSQSEAQFQMMLSEIHRDFPNNEPIGNGIKAILDVIRKNLDTRHADPFVELNMVSEIAKDIKSFDLFVKKYSCPVIFVERSWLSNETGRDFLLIFTDHTYYENWSSFRSALHFVFRHFGRYNYIQTHEIIEDSSNQCPHYTVCKLELRVQNPDICKMTPWKSLGWDGWGVTESSCWYGDGVLYTIGNNKRW